MTAACLAAFCMLGAFIPYWIRRDREDNQEQTTEEGTL